MPVLLIFVDGLGIGRREAANPFYKLPGAEPLAIFKDKPEVAIVFDGKLIRTDARLSVEGRPQSASGQTTILTGVNVPALLGFHKQGFPNAAMREIIAEHSIFLQLKKLKIEPNVFANAYTPQFFTETPRWKSATTVAVEAAGMPFRTLEDLKNGAALFHDFTNKVLRERGFDIELRSPEQAGKILSNIATQHRFTLYEYFITDRIGHEQNMAAAQIILPTLAKFVRTVLETIDLSKTTVLLTSDHGNIEDLSIRNHTLNEVPTLVWGKHQETIAEKVKSLADITPAIIEAFTK